MQLTFCKYLWCAPPLDFTSSNVVFNLKITIFSALLLGHVHVDFPKMQSRVYLYLPENMLLLSFCLLNSVLKIDCNICANTEIVILHEFLHENVLINWDIVEEKVRPWLQVHDTSQFYWRWQGEAGGRSCNLQIRSNRSQCSLAWVCINFPLTVITGFSNAMNRIKTVRLTFLGTPVISIRQGLTVRLSISTDRPAPVRSRDKSICIFGILSLF